MKKFSFPLGRVMDWRRTQARLEESKLEQLYAELHAIDAAKATLVENLAKSEKALVESHKTTGADLTAFDSYRRNSIAEQARLEKNRADCEKRVAAQRQIVAKRRTDARLLERLKDQRFRKWQAELNKEIDAQAEEAHLAKLNRRTCASKEPVCD